MDNLALMNQSTSRIDRDQLNRLEDLLSAERAKNKSLIELIGQHEAMEGRTSEEVSLANER